MGEYVTPRREPRYICNEKARFLITRTVNGQVSIIESDGRIVERSEKGLRINCISPIDSGDTVLVDISGDAAPDALYSPYNVVWQSKTSGACIFGCRMNPANDPLGMVPEDGLRVPLLSEGDEKTMRTLNHDVLDHLAGLSMALDFLKTEHSVQNRKSEYLGYAETSMEKVRQSLEDLVTFMMERKGP